MLYVRTTCCTLALSLVLCLITTTAWAQRNAPAFDYQTVMETYFDDTSGLISFTSYRIAFAPEEPFKGEIVVANQQGEIVARHAFSETYAGREGVFATVRAVGPADVQLTEPGLYQALFVVDGNPVTRLPFVLRQTKAGDDPFNPQIEYSFDGFWRTLAFFTEREYGGGKAPEFNCWLGGVDLLPDTRRGSFNAVLERDGRVVAHSKAQRGSISEGHFERKKFLLFQPHEPKKAANAIVFSMDDMKIDGMYQLKIVRPDDNQLLRAYDFVVADGEVQGIAESALETEPVYKYIMPRVLKPGTTTFEMIPCTWIRQGG